jgi:hypothetical protein
MVVCQADLASRGKLLNLSTIFSCGGRGVSRYGGVARLKNRGGRGGGYDVADQAHTKKNSATSAIRTIAPRHRRLPHIVEALMSCVCQD